MALGHFALGIELEQLVGHVAHGFLHPCLSLCPLRSAQSTQRRPCAFRGPIFLNQVEPRERDVQLGCFGKFEQHELARGVTLREFLQSLVLRDAMFDVDDIIADDKVAKVREEGRNFRLLPQRL